MRPREERLPYGELGALARPIRRATATRILLALALCGLFLAALAVAFSRDARPNPVLPPGTTGMIVLDLSASTSAQLAVGELLRRVAAANDRTGVVVFSDGAYELVPPGTPGRELAPMIRFFSPGPDGTVPEDPWSPAFAGGTNVVAGIERALDSLARDGIERGSLLLISDLEYVPEQIARLPSLLPTLRRRGVDVRILAVDARPVQRRFFERVLGPEAFVDVDAAAAVATRPAAGDGGAVVRLAEEGTPWLFAALAGVLLALLAANERLCARLRLPAPGGEGG